MSRAVVAFFVLSHASVGFAEEQAYFTRDVVPGLTAAGCNVGHCHGSPKAEENGGLRLSLFGERPLADYVALVDGPSGSLVDPEKPGRSVLLERTTGDAPHATGNIAAPVAVAVAIRRWIEQGADPPGDEDPTITTLRFAKARRVAKVGDVLDWSVKAVDSKGTTFDVSGLAKFHIATGEHVVLVREEQGGPRVSGPGRAVVVARYAGRTATTAVDVRFAIDAAEPFEFDSDNLVDRHLAQQWQAFGLQPASPAEDRILARRAWVHLTGRNPDFEKVREFVASDEPDKWSRWIDAALDAPTVAEHERNLWIEWLGMLETAGQRTKSDRGIFEKWLADELRKETSYRDLVERLLLAEGTITDDPAVGYLFGEKDDDQRTAMVARDLLGVSIRCFACHDHPLGDYTTRDHHGLVAILHGYDEAVARNDDRRLVFRPTPYRDPERRMRVDPGVLGEPLDLAASEGDPRRAFAEWLFARDNLVHARVVVNRYWGWLASEPLLPDEHYPWPARLSLHPELLDALARDLVEHDYDTRHLVWTIVSSRAYRFATEPIGNGELRSATKPFHRDRTPQRLPARVLVDLLAQVTDVPAGEIEMPENAGFPFGVPLGGAPRRGTCELPDNSNYLSSALHLLNSDVMQKLIQHEKGRCQRWANSDRDWRSFSEEAFAATYCRAPTDQEWKILGEHFEKQTKDLKGRATYAEDVLWALINSKEFLFLE